MSFNKSFSELKFDKRMKDWNLKQGFVTEQEYQDRLKSLDDAQDNSVLLSIEESAKSESDSSSPNQEDTEQIEESIDSSN